MPTDATTHQPGMGPPGRRDVILQLLRASAEPRSIASVADELGVHPNTVRFHLDALAARGPRRTSPRRLRRSRPSPDPVSRQPPDGPHRADELSAPRRILTGYVARDPDAAGIAAQLGRSTSPALVASSAQRRAPSRTRAVTELVELLAELGFEPEPADGRRAREIRLRHCPFQNLAEQHGEVICSVHLGLMQGALSAMRAPVTVDRLDPFVEPDLCVAHLAPAPYS